MKVIYTSIFGNYDRLIEPIQQGESIDYICFTDVDTFTSDVWQIVKVKPYIKDDPVRSARHYKICPHRYLEQYEYSLYVDGNMRIRLVPDIEEMLNGSNIALEFHRKRKCIYSEAKVCKERNLDSPELIDRQIESYWAMGYPMNSGLYASYLIVRKHNEIAEFSERWWADVCAFSCRDQISFPVAFRNCQVYRIPTETRRRLLTMMRHKRRK